MRKLYALRAYLTLCILAVSSLIGGVSAQAQYYELVTAADQLQPNDKCLIVNVSAGKALSTTQNKNNRGEAAVTITNNRIETVGTDVCVLTLEQQDDKWAFNTGNGYLCAASSSYNYLRTETTLSNNSKATIVINDKGETTIEFTGNYTHNILRYNASSSIFSCYASGQQPVVLFRYVSSSNPTPVITFSEEAYNVQLFGEPLEIKAVATLEGTEISDAKISYISSDPEVAAIDAETGVVTAKKEGKVTITAKVEATETYTAKSATCELTVTDPRTAPEFSFAEALYTVNIDQTMQIKPVTNSTGVVSYASSDATVAEIDAEGNVTAKTEGEATITATIAATDEFKSATATCLVKVVDPNKPAEVVTPMQFKKITSVDELIDGGQYVIVCERKNVVSAPYDKDKEYVNKVDATVSASAIDLNDGFGVITLKKYTSNWSLCLGDKYIGKTKANNFLNFDAYDSGNNYKWTIEFDTEGNAQIKSVGQSAYQMAYNSSSPRFSSYTSKSNMMNVQLYRLETSATINEKVGYTTFYTDKKYQMPAGLTAYAVAQAEETGTVTMQQAYGEGENVPAHTALLMGGEAGTYRLPVLNTEVPAYEGSNLLEGRRSADNMTSSERENVLYYKLTLLGGENPGFYWGAEGGAAFVMKNPTTAYLAVPETVAAANGFRLVMGDATGIGSVTAAAAQDSAAIYTLSGVRVNATTAAGLPKGIYIVNGRKLLVK